MWPWSYMSAILNEVIRLRYEIQQLRSKQALHNELTTKSLKFLSTRLAYVGPVVFTQTGESDMGLKFKIVLPPTTAPDVVSGELAVKIDGGEPIITATAATDTEVSNDAFVGEDGATVELSYLLIDDAGNRSLPSTAVGTLTDTIAPPQPGQLAIVVTEEI